jgi:pre-mRNA-processing factor 19
LESFTLKQTLETTRQELSQALYQHDAACRVIARLVRERDSARAALTAAQAAIATRNSNAQAAGNNSTAAPADIDMAGTGGMTESLLVSMKDKHKELSRGRKKRTVDAETATSEAIATLAVHQTYTPHAASQPGITALAVHPSPERQSVVLTGGADRNILLFDTEAGRVVGRCGAAGTPSHAKRITSVAFHPERDVLLSSGADSVVNVWANTSVPTSGTTFGGDYNVAASLRPHTKEITSLTVHPLGDIAVSLSRDATVALSDIAVGRVVSVFSDAAVTSAYESGGCHPDGLLVLGGAEDGSIRVWDVREGKIVASLSGHSGAVDDVAFSENGYYVASAGSDKTVRIWDLRHIENAATVINASAAVSTVSFDRSGLYLAGGLVSGAVNIWSSKDWSPVWHNDAHSADVTSVRFGRHAKTLFSTSMDRTLKVFKTA